MDNFRLSTAPASVKMLFTAFLLTMGIGYLVALANLYDKTEITYQGIVKHYQGAEEELVYTKELSELLELSHVHLLGMPMMFLLLGLIFALSSLSENLKGIIVVIPFAALLLEVSSVWLTRYVAAPFAGLMIFAGLLSGFSFLVLFLVPLWEMWFKKSADTFSK
ncbi:MAG: hypothetical protein ACE5OR_01700 [bacterium]